MSDETERLFRSARAPDEEPAGERARQVALAAFAERESEAPVRRFPLGVVALVLLLAAAIAAIAASPAGSWIRDKIGRERVVAVAPAGPTLSSLPAPGRLLVTSAGGAWVVNRDGSRRFLGDYEGASWSPNGLFVAVWRGRELAAVEPRRTGAVHWSLSRGQIADARWTGDRDDTRIAYRSGSTLRVVAGDGTDDRELAPRVAAVAPAWRPGTEHVLAYVDGAGRAVAVDADTETVRWRTPHLAHPLALEWTQRPERLLVVTRRAVRTFDSRGKLVTFIRLPPSERATGATFRPGSGEIAYAVYQAATAKGSLFLYNGQFSRLLFAGGGRLRDVVWSPDGRYVLVAWEAAGQWLVIPARPLGRPVAVSNIGKLFRSGPAPPTARFPRVEGWCCAPS